jgi:PPOX class probable F420-dependent enzyme
VREAGTRAVLARGATAIGSSSVGAVAAGAAAFGAVAIGALAIRSIAIKRGKVGRLSIEELEVGRLRVGELVVEEERGGPGPFENLEGHNYVSLTTFRRSGDAVPTTLWFALVDGRLYATTPPDSGKMKRIRNDPRVILTPCNAWGRPRGESVEGLARAVNGEAPGRAEVALREKYRLGLALLHLFGEHEIGRVTLEVSPADAEGA